jgi:hypothetical protein
LLEHLFVHAHHLRHWAHGGPTTADNLALLCSSHHRSVHEGGFTITRLPDGELLFMDPQGRNIEAAPRPPALEGEGMAVIESLNSDAGLQIHADTGMSRWEGDALDYQWAIDAVLRESFMPMDSTGFTCLTTAALSEQR